MTQQQPTGVVPVSAEVPEIAELARTIHDLIDRGLGEHALSAAVRDEVEALLGQGFEIPAAKQAPRPERYAVYPLYVAADGSLSIASAVWDVGQATQVHGHETWGVVGICSGVEVETRFEKPSAPDRPLVVRGTSEWSPGQVTVCCTTDDDVHQVRCGGDRPAVGLHVYGADVGTLPRRGYDPETGAVHWFTSPWAS